MEASDHRHRRIQAEEALMWLSVLPCAGDCAMHQQQHTNVPPILQHAWFAESCSQYSVAAACAAVVVISFLHTCVFLGETIHAAAHGLQLNLRI